MRCLRWAKLTTLKDNKIVRAKVTDLKVFRKTVEVQKIILHPRSKAKMVVNIMLAVAASPITV